MAGSGNAIFTSSASRYSILADSEKTLIPLFDAEGRKDHPSGPATVVPGKGQRQTLEFPG
jgi:hypothetical protein